MRKEREAMSEPVINTDEMVGFIIRNLADYRGINLTYEEIQAVLELEESFLKSKGIIEEADTAER